MVNASQISIASLISSGSMLTLFITGLFTISDKLVETENEIDQLTKQLSLLETQIEDKKHENVVTRIMNAKALLDSCNPSTENAIGLNHQLSNAIKLASLEKKFDEAETELNKTVGFLKECDYFNQSPITNGSIPTFYQVNSDINMYQRSLSLIQASRGGSANSQSITTNQTNTASLILEVPSDISLLTDNPDGEQIFYTAIGLDYFEGRLVPKCNPSPGNIFTIGETIVSCKITNSKGEEFSKSFKITINLQ